MFNKYILDKREADSFVRQLLNIGEAMYQSGGEISRIEARLRMIGQAYGVSHISVYAKPSIIIMTVEFGNDVSRTQIRRHLERGSVNCGKLGALDILCRECADNPLPLFELEERVREIINTKQNANVAYLGQILAAAAFAIFFGGNLLDGVAAAIGALIVSIMQQHIRPYFSADLFFHLVVSFVTGVGMIGLNILVPGLHLNQILIGVIMILIPGIHITNSIRYILSGDIMSSFEKLIDSVLQAIGIAVGFMLALMAIKTNINEPVVLSQNMTILIQIVSAVVGTLGYCFMVNVRGKYIPISCVGGFISITVYSFAMKAGFGIFVSALLAAFVVGIYGEFFSETQKIANTTIYTPACICLVPGGSLFYTASALLSSDWVRFQIMVQSLVFTAVGIALGLAIVIELEKMYKRIKNIKY